MQASKKLHLKTLLSSLTVALVLAAPGAFAKKDLFANDPGAKQSHQVEQLVPTTSSSSAAPKESTKEESTSETVKTEEQAKSAAPEAKSIKESEQEKKGSYLETQFARFKGHLVETKEDLFGNKKSAKKEPLSAPPATEQTASDNAHSSEEAHPELPTITATEAAQRAQSLAEGQVINVRKYQEDDKPRYAVKLLQKNGRMKTINLDAVSGALIEETPQ